MYQIEDINHLIKNKKVSELKDLMVRENLEIINGKIVAKNAEKTKELAAYWDDIQLIRKIQLNSVYGALVNAGSNFFDVRLGQSCTLTGRCITRHMGYTINKEIHGNYEYGPAIVGGDTDSIYFTVPNKSITKDDFIIICDKIATNVNNSFSSFLNKTYNIPVDRAKAIKCGREICAETVLFAKKKRYAAMVFDEKGKRFDNNGKAGKLKVVGLDIKRSDTPKWVQDKLKDTMEYLLSKKPSEEEIIEYIRQWRNEFYEQEPWKLGSPKKVNKLTFYTKAFNDGRKITVPGHVRGAINWNNLLKTFDDRNSMKVNDGQKIIVCKLKNNKFNITSISYPIDQLFLPDWFKTLPFDKEEMVEATVDKKIETIFGSLKWDFDKTKYSNTFTEFFTWE